MSTPLRILVTGGTGFLGKRTLPILERIGGEGSVVDCISRSSPGCLRGDLTQWDAQMDLGALKGKYDVLLHLAGLYDLRASLHECMKQNVTATHNALVIAQKAEIPRFVHASTVAVTVGEKGEASERDMKRVGLDPNAPLIYPDILDTSRDFPDAYAKTKAHAEHLVLHWPTAELKLRLNLRLGVLVGDTREGTIERIDGPYHVPEFLRRSRKLITATRGRLPLPGDPSKPLPILPVDVAAQAIARLIRLSIDEDWGGYRSLHLFPSNGPNIREIYESSMRFLGIPKNELRLIHGLPKAVLKRLGEWISEIPKEELEYVLSFPRLHTGETEKILGKDWCPRFESYESAFWKGYHEYVSNS